MTKEEFCEAGYRLYGWGWQSRLAKELDMAVSTINRWATGKWPIPVPVEKWLTCEISKLN